MYIFVLCYKTQLIKRGHEFKRDQKGYIGRVGGKKGKEKMMPLYFNFKKQKIVFKNIKI